MPGSITDLTPDFLAFWEVARGRPTDEQYRLWSERYEEPNARFFAACGGRHGNPAALPAAWQRFPALIPDLPGRVAAIRTTLNATEPALATLFALDRLDLNWVLLVGMFWADGWVAAIDGQPTGFIAVEMLHQGYPRADILIAHEAAHVAHAACLGADWDDLTTLGQTLFIEGLATLASTRLVPGFEDAGYLWLGLDRTPGGQLPRDWLTACERAWPEIEARLRDDLAATDLAVIAPYVTGEQGPADLPARVGYYAGFRLVSELARSAPIAELARWPPGQIQEAMTRSLS